MKKFSLPFLLLAAFAVHGQNVYLKAEGQKTGNITDDQPGVLMPIGRTQGMMVDSYSFEVASPRDPATGLATGRRVHGPLVITKKAGRSSPLFFNVLATNENLTKLTLQIYKTNASGQDELFETIELTNASLASYKQDFDSTPAAGQDKGPTDTIRLTYQKITITYVKGGTTAQDDWNQIN